MKSEYFVLDVRTTVIHICVLAAVVCGLSYWGGRLDAAFGWLVGTGIGFADYLVLYRSVVRNLDKSPHKALAGMRKSWLVRLAVMTAAVLFSIKVGLVMAAVMIAILAVHAITLVDAVWLACRRRKA